MHITLNYFRECLYKISWKFKQVWLKKSLNWIIDIMRNVLACWIEHPNLGVKYLCGWFILSAEFVCLTRKSQDRMVLCRSWSCWSLGYTEYVIQPCYLERCFFELLLLFARSQILAAKSRVFYFPGIWSVT